MNVPAQGVERLLGLLALNRRGERAGITSICSAEPHVLEAAASGAASSGGLLCIESTANQVNQEGGYTGMTPAAFHDAVTGIAAAGGVPATGLVIGGDHLGPYPWRKRPAREAMAAARRLVRDCVLAGYTKLHLDASMACADDPGGAGGPLDDETATARAVDLCRVAEEAHAGLPAGAPRPVYVIGTEVPAPGGEVAGATGPLVTPAAAAEHTLDLAREGFAAAGLSAAWERVVAVVVQPGVEFGDHTITAYDPDSARELRDFLKRRPPFVYEAHSTDYQTPAALSRMIADGFAVLKVGPWLTFAFREAVFALEGIEIEMLGRDPGLRPSRLRETLDAVMVRHPEDWAAYYRGAEGDVRFDRAFSYSDRCRYYWPQAEVQEALATLLRNLSERPIPATLLSQYLPCGHRAVQEGRVAPEPAALIRHHIGRVLDVYAAACGDRSDSGLAAG